MDDWEGLDCVPLFACPLTLGPSLSSKNFTWRTILLPPPICEIGLFLGKIWKMGSWTRNEFQFWGSLAVYFFVGVVILVFEFGSYFVMGIVLGNISRAICLFRII